MIRSIAGSIARPIAVAITGASGVAAPAPEAPEALEAVRALDTSNGGDLDVSILDFGKTGKVYSDFAGTEAGEGDSVALVLDDLQDEALGADRITNGGFDASLDGWSTGYLGTQGGSSITQTAGVCQIVHDGTPNYAGIWQSIGTFTADDWIRVRFTWGGDVARVWARVSNTDSLVGGGSFVTMMNSGSTPGDYEYWIQAPATGTLYLHLFENNPGTTTIDAVSADPVPGNHAYQSSAASQPVLETDAFGTLVAAMDGVDDSFDLPNGWHGTQKRTYAAIAMTPTDISAANILVDNITTQYGLRINGSGELQLTIGESGSGSATSVSYARPITANEPIIIEAMWDAGDQLATLAINGVTVATAVVTYANQDSLTPVIFGQGEGLYYGAVAANGDRLPNDAERATIRTYLASLTGDTLLDAAPLTVLRRVATPATDLNVDDTFDYADTAALTAVWEDTSSNDHSIAQGSSALQLVPNASGGGRPTAEHIAGYPCRVGYRYTVTPSGDATFMSLGTTKGGNDIVNAASGSSAQTFVASTDRVFVTFQGAIAGQPTQEVTGVGFEEIARTTALYDFLDETRMTDSSGATQELDSGIELVLPSVADGDDAFGAELVTNGGFDTDTDWTRGAGWAISGGVATATSSNANLAQTQSGGAGLYRFEYTISNYSSGQVRIRTNDTAGIGTYQSSNGTFVEYIESGAFTSILFNSSSNFSGSIDDVSVKKVLHYPLQQTSAASQPELQYAPHQYLDGVVFSGRETSTGSITSATTLQDLSGNSNQPAVNGTLTVSAVGDATVYSGFSSANVLRTADDILAVGTGAFSITVAFRGITSNDRIVHAGRYDGGWVGPQITLQDVSGTLTAYFSDDAFSTRDGIGIEPLANLSGSTDAFNIVTFGKNSDGDFFAKLDDGAVSTLTPSNATGSLTLDAAGDVLFGASQNSQLNSFEGELATIILATSGYAPTDAELTSLHADLAQIYSGVAGSYQFAEVVFDGTDDRWQAIDPNGDLAITGDVTLLAALTPDRDTTEVYLASGDAATGTTDGAYIAFLGATSLRFRHGDASSHEDKHFTDANSAISADRSVVLSHVRSGSDITFGIDTTQVGTSTFGTVTAPTAGSSPVTKIGSNKSDASPFAGGIAAVGIIDGALPTGQIVHMERALREHINGVTE